MEQTPKLKLNKPGESDYADIAVLNGNMDAIDEAVSNLDTGKADLDPETHKVRTDQMPPLDFDPAGAADAVQAALGTHTADAVKHITAAERSGWNSKAAGNHTHTAAQVGADAAGTAAGAVSTHNGDAAAHPSIVQAIKTWAQGAFAVLAHKHSAADITSGTLPVPRGGTGGTTPTTARSGIGACARYSYSVTIPTSSWTTATVGWYKDITVSGVTAAMNPTAGLVQSSDAAAAKLQLEAWGCVSRMTTAANSVRVYCYEELPQTQITVRLEGTVA